MTQPPARPNAEQAEYWNSAPGRTWLAHEDMLDTLLGEVETRLVERADPRPGERAVDIGCGTGATARVLAARVGPDGRVLGVDISEPLLQRARERSAGLTQLSFLLADAQSHRFEEGDADLLASRFGVMFFDDPVAAFRNMLTALRPGGRIAFVAWGPVDGNPWFTIPRDAAIARVGKPAPQPPTAPGPLAFADRDRVRSILDEAGCSDIQADAEGIHLVWPGELAALAGLSTSVGPAARILREREGGPEDEAAVRESVTEKLSGFFRGPEGFRIPASLNFFSARRP